MPNNKLFLFFPLDIKYFWKNFEKSNKYVISEFSSVTFVS